MIPYLRRRPGESAGFEMTGSSETRLRTEPLQTDPDHVVRELPRALVVQSNRLCAPLNKSATDIDESLSLPVGRISRDGLGDCFQRPACPGPQEYHGTKQHLVGPAQVAGDTLMWSAGPTPLSMSS